MLLYLIYSWLFSHRILYIFVSVYHFDYQFEFVDFHIFSLLFMLSFLFQILSSTFNDYIELIWLNRVLRFRYNYDKIIGCHWQII